MTALIDSTKELVVCTLRRLVSLRSRKAWQWGMLSRRSLLRCRRVLAWGSSRIFLLQNSRLALGRGSNHRITLFSPTQVLDICTLRILPLWHCKRGSIHYRPGKPLKFSSRKELFCYKLHNFFLFHSRKELFFCTLNIFLSHYSKQVSWNYTHHVHNYLMLYYKIHKFDTS